MIWMVVVATKFVSSSKQLTTVLFRAPLTGLTVILDISGRTFGPESLEKVIMMEVPILSGGGMPLTPVIVTGLAV
jgi:hypothetical protein